MTLKLPQIGLRINHLIGFQVYRYLSLLRSPTRHLRKLHYAPPFPKSWFFSMASFSMASLYISRVKTYPPDTKRTFRIVFPIHSLARLSLIQFAHHLSMLPRIPEEFNSFESLCSQSTWSKKPIFRCSRPNSDKHFKIRDMRRLLCDAPW